LLTQPFQYPRAPSGDISWHKGRVFISEVCRFEVLGFEQVDEGFYMAFGMLRLVSLTRMRFASGRFRSSDEWMFGVIFRQAGGDFAISEND